MKTQQQRPISALEREAVRLTQSHASIQEIHEWLCHPGERCADGCDAEAISSRLAAYKKAETSEE